jgi:hypothetical protein
MSTVGGGSSTAGMFAIAARSSGTVARSYEPKSISPTGDAARPAAISGSSVDATSMAATSAPRAVRDRARERTNAHPEVSVREAGIPPSNERWPERLGSEAAKSGELERRR